MTKLLKCSQCGAELLPETNFCRRCGATAKNSGEVSSEGVTSSELPTEVFAKAPGSPTTRRLESRTTSPDRALRQAIAAVNIEAVPDARRRRRSALIGGAVAVVILIGLLAAVAYFRISSHSRTTDDAALIYPGSRTIVDVASGDGRAIQLQTDDSLEQVITWYEVNLKPTKTMRLTSTSIVLKNENVTTTLATEAGKTNILIKRVR